MTKTSTSRDQDIRQACRRIGSILNAYVTGDPGADDIAEYVAAGWVRTDDYYREPDDTPQAGTEQLARSLDLMAQAFARLSADVKSGDCTLDTVRGIEVPAW